MKFTFVAPVVALAFGVVSTMAFAQSAQAADRPVTSLLYTCDMSFHAKGGSAYLGIGYTEIAGDGMLSCYDFLTGSSENIPLKIKAHGPGAGLGITKLILTGGASGLGLTTGPESLFGHYALMRGNAAVGVGVGAGAAIRLSNGAATINITAQAETGLGIGVDILSVDIEAADPNFARNRKMELGQPAPTSVVQKQDRADIAQPNSVPVVDVSLKEGQPIHLVDQSGHLVELIFVHQK